MGHKPSGLVPHFTFCTQFDSIPCDDESDKISFRHRPAIFRFAEAPKNQLDDQFGFTKSIKSGLN